MLSDISSASNEDVGTSCSEVCEAAPTHIVRSENTRTLSEGAEGGYQQSKVNYFIFSTLKWYILALHNWHLQL